MLEGMSCALLTGEEVVSDAGTFLDEVVVDCPLKAEIRSKAARCRIRVESERGLRIKSL